MIPKFTNHILGCVIGLSLMPTLSFAQQMQIQPNQTALQLAQKITGKGVVVTNARLNCATNANGVFAANQNLVGLDSGIVLSTGIASQMSGPEPGVNSTNLNRAGDAQLTAISGTTSTRDACVLEFDITPSGDRITFDYVFTSEEYVNAVCGPFNDVFAFFISGPGIAGSQNIALVPNTNIPVAVNSVNNGIPGSYANGSTRNCSNMGAGSPFTQYYTDNSGSSHFAYRGFTAVFTASQVVMPCSTYHLKLAVADAGNALYDSGVLLKAGSLNSSSIKVQVASTPNQTTKNLYKGCASSSVTFTRSQVKPTPQTLQVTYAGNAVVGVDYQLMPSTVTIPANAASVTIPIVGIASNVNTQQLKISVLDPFTCGNNAATVSSDSLSLLPKPVVEILTQDTAFCASNSLQISVASNNPLTEFYWTPNLNINNVRLQNPVVSPTATTTYKLTAQIPNSGCGIFEDSVTVSIIEGPDSLYLGEDIKLCAGFAFQIQPVLTPNLANVTYSWTGPNGFVASTKNLSINNAQLSHSGSYTLTASIPGCASISSSVIVQVLDGLPVPIVETPVLVCLNQEVQLKATGSSLKWFTQEFGGIASNEMPKVKTEELGQQTFYVAQSLGNCSSDRAKIDVHVIKCCEYEVQIPNAFTPNGDGLNDEFKVLMDPQTKITWFEVYNRYGQRVYIHTGKDMSWDGTLRGQPLDVGVYYYNMRLECEDGRTSEKKGDITLLR